MAGDRWLYTPQGAPAFYQQGKFLYSAQTNKCEYFEDSGWIYTIDGKPAFFIDNGWLFTVSGASAYFYG
jgi:hypothetical protein